MATFEEPPEASAPAGPTNKAPLSAIYSGQLPSSDNVSAFATESKQISCVGHGSTANLNKMPSGPDIKPPSRIQRIADKYIRPQMGKQNLKEIYF
jgi:hypothetical protein